MIKLRCCWWKILPSCFRWILAARVIWSPLFRIWITGIRTRCSKWMNVKNWAFISILQVLCGGEWCKMYEPGLFFTLLIPLSAARSDVTSYFQYWCSELTVKSFEKKVSKTLDIPTFERESTAIIRKCMGKLMTYMWMRDSCHVWRFLPVFQRPGFRRRDFYRYSRIRGWGKKNLLTAATEHVAWIEIEFKEAIVCQKSENKMK